MANPIPTPETIRQDFGAWLHEKRRENGMTQEKLAELSGVSRQQIVRIERGQSGSSRDNISAIAAALKVSPIEALRKAGFAAEYKSAADEEITRIVNALPYAMRPALVQAVRAMAQALNASHQAAA